MDHDFTLHSMLTPSIGVHGELVITQQIRDPLDEAREKITILTFNACDRMVREYLINLGWAPPEDKPVAQVLESIGGRKFCNFIDMEAMEKCRDGDALYLRRAADER
jgi:hypothetical protein